jgi:hypothetical protein
MADVETLVVLRGRDEEVPHDHGGQVAELGSEGDFGSGTIRPWLISTPRRGAVRLGKLAASLPFLVIGAVALVFFARRDVSN